MTEMIKTLVSSEFIRFCLWFIERPMWFRIVVILMTVETIAVIVPILISRYVL